MIVDEAQDLTPMQLGWSRGARRGSLTVLGDIAQATGPVVPALGGLLGTCRGGEDGRGRGARHAYRVPREIMELALPLLERIAPEVAAAARVPRRGAPPRFVRVETETLLARRSARPHELAREDGLVAVIAPAPLAAASSSASAFDGRGSRC